MQVQKKESFSRNNRHKNESGLIKAMKNIVETSGGRPITQGFYRGLNSCLLRDFFFAPLFFGQYQLWKRYLDLDSLQKDKSKKNERYAKSFVAGAVSLFSAWAIIFPLDVIKT